MPINREQPDLDSSGGEEVPRDTTIITGVEWVLQGGRGLVDQITTTESVTEESESPPLRVTDLEDVLTDTMRRAFDQARQTRRGMSFATMDSTRPSLTLMDNDGSSEDHSHQDITPDTIVPTRKGDFKASDCHYYNGRWYHKKDEELVKDYITGGLLHCRQAQEIVVKAVFKSTNKVVKCTYGHIPTKVYEACPIAYSTKYNWECKILSIDCVEGWEYKESLSRGQFVDADYEELPLNKVTHYDSYKNHFSKCEDFKLLTKLGQISPSYTITEGLPYTFGVEIECCKGFLPSWVACSKQLNVLCIRDGSINNGEGGAEYVTGVLKGDTGFRQLQDICLELSRRTLVNATCGNHFHIGNINFSKQFLVNSYKLALLLEEEIFSTLPASRRSNRYCKKLKKFKFRPAINSNINYEIDLEEDYNALFKYISVEKVNNPTFEYNKSKQHPLGAKCGYNHDTPRYCWLNYVPAMFNTRNNGSYSLEFRAMNGSTNFTKIKNTLLLNFAFCAFAEKHPEEIVEGITIETVISRIFPKKAKSLNRFFNLRKELFKNVEIEKEEYKQSIDENKLSIKELIND